MVTTSSLNHILVMSLCYTTVITEHLFVENWLQFKPEFERAWRLSLWSWRWHFN